MKKLLAILLAVVMILGLVSCSMATTTEQTADGATDEAVEQPWYVRYGSIIFLVLMIVVFYFFMIRPQKKQEKEYNKMLSELQPGDEITTKGGIIGKVVSIKEETMVIETSRDRTKIRLLRSAVSKIDVKAEDTED